MIDAKKLADKLGAIGAYGTIVNIHITIPETDLIIAALRAYEPPCAHRWDMKDDGREWWWASDEKVWKHRCCVCNMVEDHLYLVPAPDVPVEDAS